MVKAGTDDVLLVQGSEAGASEVKDDSNGDSPNASAAVLPPSGLAEFSCPHCCGSFPVFQVLWVSQHEELLGDPVLGPQAHSRFRPSRFNLRGEAIDARDVPCQLLACPQCHQVIPRPLITAKSLFVSILGAPGGGEPQFLGGMFRELRHVLLSKFLVELDDADSAPDSLLNEDRPLVSDDSTSPAVSIGTNGHRGTFCSEYQFGPKVNESPRPYMFTLHGHADAGSRVSAPGGRHAAGEIAGEMEGLCVSAIDRVQLLAGAGPSAQAWQLCRSQAILFFYEPALNPRRRERRRKTTNGTPLKGASPGPAQETLLAEACSCVRSALGIASHEKHAATLIVVTRRDIWAAAARGKSCREPFVASPNRERASAIDMDRVERVSRALRRIMLKRAPEFVAAAEGFCERVVYVPVSDLAGGPPRNTRAPGLPRETVHPRWLTVPLLYAAAQWPGGLVGGSRKVQAPLKSAAMPRSLSGWHMNDTSVCLQPLERVRSFLDGSDSSWTEELSGVAIEYASLCREANRRLDRCRDYLQRGLRCEAVHLAECSPSLIEFLTALSVARFKRWSRLCAVAHVPTPPDLPASAAKELEAARSLDRELQPWVSKHRILAMTGAPVVERWRVARELVEKDPDNAIWRQCAADLEAPTLREIQERASGAIREEDVAALESIALKLSAQPWIDPLAKQLRLDVEAALNQRRRADAFEPMRGLLIQIMTAYHARSYHTCVTLISSWNAAIESRRIQLDPEIEWRLRQVFDWLSDEMSKRSVAERLEAIKHDAGRWNFRGKDAAGYGVRLGVFLLVLGAVAVAVFLVIQFLNL